MYYTCGGTVKPAREASPKPMMGTQQAASVATKRVILQAMADSELRLSRATASWVVRAAMNIQR